MVDYADGTREMLPLDGDLRTSLVLELRDDPEEPSLRIAAGRRTLFVSAGSGAMTKRWARRGRPRPSRRDLLIRRPLQAAVVANAERAAAAAREAATAKQAAEAARSTPPAARRGFRNASLPVGGGRAASVLGRRLLGARQSFQGRAAKAHRRSFQVPVAPIKGVVALPPTEATPEPDAPPPAPPPPPPEPEPEPIVEDEADEVVGEMRAEATGAVSFLEEELASHRHLMQTLYSDGTNEGSAPRRPPPTPGGCPPSSARYQAAYQALAAVGTHQTAVASGREFNQLKNRYGNIKAYDDTRVILPVLGDDPDTDYVNANWVSGFERDRAYIASQAPVPNSMISFWRMVWHCKVESIVMVTNEVEKGRMKCHRYWSCSHTPLSAPSTAA